MRKSTRRREGIRDVKVGEEEEEEEDRNEEPLLLAYDGDEESGTGEREVERDHSIIIS